MINQALLNRREIVIYLYNKREKTNGLLFLSYIRKYMYFSLNDLLKCCG